MSPGALSRKEAAEYVGVSPVTFDKLIREGEMPKGRRYQHVDRIVWLVAELQEYLNRLPVDGEASADELEEVDL